MPDYRQSLPDPRNVHDRASFVQFVRALVADREQAEALEQGDPERYAYGGANGWENGQISGYLECALAGMMAQPEWNSLEQPTWRAVADFLYLGKIYE